MRPSASRSPSPWYDRFVIFRPDLRVDRVEQLDIAYLADHGVRALLLDLDETLLPAGAAEPTPQVVAWATSLLAGGVRLAIVSNGRPGRVRRTAAKLGVSGRWLTGKPWPGAYRRGLRDLDVPASEAAMVGDQLFTDVVGARAAGLRTILVPPLSSAGLPHTRLLRRLEAVLLSGGDRGRPVHR